MNTLFWLILLVVLYDTIKRGIISFCYDMVIVLAHIAAFFIRIWNKLVKMFRR